MIDFIKKAFKAKKAVIMARVSSKEQEEGYSIDAQLHRLENYCLRNHLEIIRHFDIVESSTQGDRRDFMEMIAFVKKQKETIALVADKIDRVQRSFKEYPLLDALVQEGRIELHFNTENYVIHKESMSQERLMWSMGVIMAQSYVDSLRDNVKRSIDQKLRMGEWIALAPLGYLNLKDSRKRGEIVVDDERAHFIRRMFTEFATGTLTLGELSRRATEWGLRNRGEGMSKLSVSQVHKIIHNPFYYGIMKVKGKYYTHRYPPLIDKILFDECQEVIKKWKKKQFKYGDREYLFRGLLTCANTRRVVTADTKSKTYLNGKSASWTYLGYWNDQGKKAWVREDKIMAQVTEALKPFNMNPEVLPEVIEYIKASHKVESEFVSRQREEMNKKIEVIQYRIDRLLNLYLDGLIDKDDLERKKSELTIERNQLINETVLSLQSDDRFKDAAIAIINLVSDLPNRMQEFEVGEKRNILKMVFSNLSVKEGSLCFTYNKLFDEFKNCTTHQQWRTAIDNIRTTEKVRKILLHLYNRHFSSCCQ